VPWDNQETQSSLDQDLLVTPVCLADLALVGSLATLDLPAQKDPRVWTEPLETDTPEDLVTPATEETQDAPVPLVSRESVESKELRAHLEQVPPVCLVRMDEMEGTAVRDDQVIEATQEILVSVESQEMPELTVHKVRPAVTVDLAILVDLDTLGDPEIWP
jgi:hypothetical protein